MQNNRIISQRGIDLIKHYEGLRLQSYKPVEGDHWTIGYGSTRGVYEGMRITQQEADDRLRSDIGWAESAVNRLVRVPLSQAQFDSLVSFCFNVGVGAFERSTLLRVLNQGGYDKVDHQLSLWVWGGRPKQVLDGLIKRRRSEAELFEDFAPRLFAFKNHATAVHSKEDHNLVDTVKESRTAKTGVVIAGGGSVEAGSSVLAQLNDMSSQASTLSEKFAGIIDPQFLVPLVMIGVGLYIVYLKHTDKLSGRSY